jgi:hypothetical protein
MPRKFKTSKAELDELLEEATTDAYGDQEQFSGVLVTVEENLPFPFEAQVTGYTFHGRKRALAEGNAGTCA